MSGALFPHFGFSFYDDPPGRIIRKGKGDIPSLFQSNRLLTMGLHSLMKQVNACDIFTDQGLASYRGISFLMMMGTSDQLLEDLGCLYDPLLSLDGDENKTEISRALERMCGTPYGHRQDVYERIHENKEIYEEVFHLDIQKDTGYLDFIYLTAQTMTSIELSHKTVLNLIREGGGKLRTLFQAPLCPDLDKTLLSSIFSFDESKTRQMVWNENNHLLFGVFPGMFGFEGAIFDVTTGIVSGKRKDLVRFLLFLNGTGILAERDLRYLV